VALIFVEGLECSFVTVRYVFCLLRYLSVLLNTDKFKFNFVSKFSYRNCFPEYRNLCVESFSNVIFLPSVFSRIPVSFCSMFLQCYFLTTSIFLNTGIFLLNLFAMLFSYRQYFPEYRYLSVGTFCKFVLLASC
jgi:hypothetical protein